ncbi:hypothetical protein Emag_005910 [Eimeria magna]
MTLRRLGEKLKTSLHHLSPKSKKTDESQGGDLSPCSLPPTATSAAAQPSAPLPMTCEDQAGAGKSCAQANECQKSCGSTEQKIVKEETIPIRAETPAPTITTAEPDCPPMNLTNCTQPSEVACSERASTPRYEEAADIFPTMYYAVKTENTKEPVQQSVLLVNPSRSDKARKTSNLCI